jgi:uncharacterized membrane protein YkoI
MQRLSASRRQALTLALAVTVGGGIGYGAYTLGSAAGSDTVTFPRAASATATGTGTGTVSGPSAEASGSSPLTIDQAMEIAVAAAPGRVIEWDEDHEPAGLRYDVTLLHDDGSTTDVEVDTVTGQVTSIDHDRDGD